MPVGKKADWYSFFNMLKSFDISLKSKPSLKLSSLVFTSRVFSFVDVLKEKQEEFTNGKQRVASRVLSQERLERRASLPLFRLLFRGLPPSIQVPIGFKKTLKWLKKILLIYGWDHDYLCLIIGRRLLLCWKIGLKPKSSSTPSTKNALIKLDQGSFDQVIEHPGKWQDYDLFHLHITKCNKHLHSRSLR